MSGACIGCLSGTFANETSSTYCHDCMPGLAAETDYAVVCTRLLIFHGPSGTGKSASIQAIAEESQVLLREWSGRHTDGDLPWKDAQRLRDHASTLFRLWLRPISTNSNEWSLYWMFVWNVC